MVMKMSFIVLSDMMFQFDYISIIILVLDLIFIIKGIVNGLLKSIICVLGGVIALVLAILLAKPLGNLLFDTALGESLTNIINDSLVNINSEAFNTPIPLENQEATISGVMTSLNIPSFFNGLVTKLVLVMISVETEGTLGFLIGQSLAKYIIYVFAGLIIFIIFKLVFFILKILTRKVNKIPLLGKFNRIGGGILGLFNAFVVVTLLMYGASLLMTIPQVNDYLTNLLSLNDPQVFSIAKWFLNENLIQKIVEAYL